MNTNGNAPSFPILVSTGERPPVVIAPVVAQARSCRCDSPAGHALLCVDDMTRVQRDTRNFRYPRVLREAGNS